MWHTKLPFCFFLPAVTVTELLSAVRSTFPAAGDILLTDSPLLPEELLRLMASLDFCETRGEPIEADEEGL